MRQSVLYSAKAGAGGSDPHIRGAGAEPRISRHAVTAKPARQGWPAAGYGIKMSLPPKNHYHSRTLQMVFIMSNITPPNMKNPIHLLAFGLGSGLARKAPGTFGTLAALPFWWFLLQGVPTLPYIGVLVAGFALG